MGSWLRGDLFSVLGFFWVSSGIREVCDDKTAWEKNWNWSFNGIPITCGLEMFFFFSRKSEIIAVMSCSRNAILNDSFTWQVSCRVRGNFAVVYLSFISEMKSNKDTRYKQINCRPDYILERMDIWCRFWKLRCFVIGTWPKCLYWRGELNAPEGQDKSSSFTADKMVWNVPPNAYEASMYHCGTWDCLN